MVRKLVTWVKTPRNIVFIALMAAVAVYGVIDNNLEIIAAVYVVVFLVGLFVSVFLYLVNQLFK